MNWIKRLDSRFPGKRARGVVGAVLVVLLVLTGLFVHELLWRYDWANGRLRDIEPRHARLEGLIGEEARLLASAQQLSAQLARQVYPAEMSVERVGTDLQQRMRQLADRHGVVTRQSQVLALREGGAVDQVPLSLLLEADSETLLLLLLDLAREEKIIHVNNVVIQGGGRGASAHKLRVQLEVNAYRSRV